MKSILSLLLVTVLAGCALSQKSGFEYKPELAQQAKEFILAVDKARNLDYKNYIPELTNFI